MSLPLALKLFYSAMALAVLSMMGLYVRGLTSPQRVPTRVKVPFYGWIAFLVLAGVFLHVLTAWRLPWVHWELDRSEIEPDREVAVVVGDHRFRLPGDGIRIRQGEIVKFAVRSEDLTYGFGVFRADGTMVFQMQVVPGHANEIIWVFSEPGRYSVRSTEYAGPDTWKMHVKDAIEVYREGEGRVFDSRA